MAGWVKHFLAAVISGILAIFNAPKTLPAPTPAPEQINYRVIKIIDGDTLEIQMASGPARIRLLGIDAPEIATGDCLSTEAKNKLTQLVGSQPIYLQRDPNQSDSDKYGRLLRYVSVDSQDISTQLLRLGLSHFLTLPTSYTLEDKLKQAESEARQNKSGLWSPYACKPAGFCEHLPVLIYHHIQPLNIAKKLGHAQLTTSDTFFEQHLKYLKEHGYTFLTVKQLVEAINSHQTLPAKSIVITIDDAYNDAYDYAYPLLKKYGAVASLFVPTGLVGNPGYLNWSQVTEMNQSGVLPAFDHTWSHYSLPSGKTDKDSSEISVAQTQLEEHLGSVPKILAYPYGSYTSQTIAILKNLGVLAAFTTRPGLWQCKGNIYSLPRLHAGNAPLSAYGL